MTRPRPAGAQHDERRHDLGDARDRALGVQAAAPQHRAGRGVLQRHPAGVRRRVPPHGGRRVLPALVGRAWAAGAARAVWAGTAQPMRTPAGGGQRETARQAHTAPRHSAALARVEPEHRGSRTRREASGSGNLAEGGGPRTARAICAEGGSGRGGSGRGRPLTDQGCAGPPGVLSMLWAMGRTYATPGTWTRGSRRTAGTAGRSNPDGTGWRWRGRARGRTGPSSCGG